MIYPWQSSQWQHLQQRLREKRLAHAFLFHGPDGVGKNEFAVSFARALLCLQPHEDGQACGQCTSCRWSATGAHPDSLFITLEKDAKLIVVDQIRSLGHFLSLKSQQGRYKVIIITPAQSMNINAANSLLKNLEEPAENTIIILVSSRSTALAPTVRSRCQKLAFPYPAHDSTLVWLQQQLSEPDHAATLLSIAKGAPLHALTMGTGDILEKRADFFCDLFNLAQGKEYPVQVAEKWIKRDIQQILSWFHTAVADMIKLNMQKLNTQEIPPSICHTDYVETLQKRARILDLKALYRCYEQIEGTQGLLKANMNPQLLIESILIPWTEINARQSPSANN